MKSTLRRRTIGLAIAAAGLSAALVGTPTTAEAQIQLTPDSGRYLIQRFVAPNEQWAISYNFEDLTLTGNVFKTDGGDPSFIWCEFTDIQYAEDPGDNQYFLDCFGADACTDAPCEASAWTPIGSGIPLPASFVLPPDTRSTFGGNVEPILNDTCAVTGCHTGATPSGGLSLEEGSAYDNIFEIMSAQRPAENFVTPFAPETSYLYAKVEGTGEGGMMPLGGMLSEPQLVDIFNWIAEGGVRN